MFSRNGISILYSLTQEETRAKHINMYKVIEKCRICGNPDLVEVVNLGKMMLTGVFPRSRSEGITFGPVSLVKCFGSTQACGLLQLKQSYDPAQLYGTNYGYRSGLNRSMVEHLHRRVDHILDMVKIKKGDLVIDIGSNDGTMLSVYPPGEFDLVGFDPVAVKFKGFYAPRINLVFDFFSKDILARDFKDKKAKIITSFSMFYDLECPLSFMRGISESLDQEGIWLFEQSYMPLMLKKISFDTICQEHLEYYALKQVKWMADKAGLKIIGVEFNDINGGSFSVTAAKSTSSYPEAADLAWLVEQERLAGLDLLDTYHEFSKDIEKAKKDLCDFINKVKAEGKKIFGLGASTKGNVILQYCGITDKDIPFIGEVNPEKFAAYTPGTFIPIIPEDDLLAMFPDYLLVLPWHFKDFFLKSPKFKNTKLVFPLPEIEVVEA